MADLLDRREHPIESADSCGPACAVEAASRKPVHARGGFSLSGPHWISASNKNVAAPCAAAPLGDFRFTCFGKDGVSSPKFQVEVKGVSHEEDEDVRGAERHYDLKL